MPRLNPFARGKVRLAQVWEGNLPDHVIALAWSPRADGSLAAAAVSGPIALFDPQTGARRHELAGHGFGTTAVAWSRHGEHLASAGQDGAVRLWDAAAGRELRKLAGGAAWVEHLAWCPAADLLASAAGKKLRLWDGAGELRREYPDHPRTIGALAWRPGTEVLASACYSTLFLWDTAQSEPARTFEWKGSPLVLRWSPDGRYLAAGVQDASVHFWVTASGEDLQMSGYPTKVRELAWDPSGHYLATGGAPAVCVWDCSGAGPAGRTPLQLETHQELVSALAYQHRGAYLASGGEDGRVALWQPGRSQGPLALAAVGAPVSQLAWSPDDRLLAAGTAEGKVIVFTLQ